MAKAKRTQAPAKSRARSGSPGKAKAQAKPAAANGVRKRVRNAVKRVEPVATNNFMFFGRTQAGVNVDADSILKNATVWACVTYLTRAEGQLPWRVCQELPDGGSKRVPTHPVDWLIHKRPNPEMGAMTFRQTLLSAALRRGNGYAEIQRDARGIPVALWPIATSRVQPKRKPETGELFYRVDNGYGTSSDVDAMNMFHLRGFPGDDGVVGLDVVSYAAQSVGWAQATEIFGASFFGEGMNFAGVVQAPKGIQKPGFDRMKEELKQLYKGPYKSNRSAVLDNGATWTRTSAQPNEAQFIETRQHQVEEICRWFGVPPHKVMHLLRATFSNIEHQSIEVVVDSIAPWAKLFEEEADYKLFGPTNRQGFYTKHYLQALMRGDAASRATFYKEMRFMGVMNADEIRELEDMNPLPNGIGKAYTMQSQNTTLDRIINPPVNDDAGASPAPADPTSKTKTKANGHALPH